MKKNYLLQLLFVFAGFLLASGAFAQTASSNITFTNLNTTSYTISWTNGSGVGRIVVLRASPNSIAYPVNNTNYSASTSFGSGSNLGNSNYVVYKGTGSSITVTNLSTYTYYYVTIFEYTGLSTSPTFQTSPYGSSGHYTLAASPTVQVTGLTATNITNNSASLSWTNGNGAYTLETLKAATTNTNLPSDGTVYSSSSNFGTGSPVGGSPYSYVTANTGGNSSSVSGLNPQTDYVAAAFTYNGLSGGQNYMTTSVPTDGFTTLANQPTTYASNLNFTDIEDDAMTISWLNATSGGGSYHLVLVNSTSASDAPIDGSIYTASSTYGSGSLIGSSYVVYAGSGNAVRVTNLPSMETEYRVMVYEYNGGTGTFNNTTNYLATPLAGYQYTNATHPGTASSNVTFTNINPTSVQVNWTPGTGQSRIVTARAGHRQTALAFDGVNDYVNVPYNSALQPTAAVTLECWVYRANWAASAPLQYYAGNAESGGYCILHTGQYIYTYAYRNNSWGSSAFSVAHLTSGWHHIAMTYDGRYLRSYVDGAYYAINDAGANYPIQYTYSNPFIIGADAGSSAVYGYYSDAIIDEVRVWNTANSQYTIQYNKNRSMLGNENGLVAEWRFDDGYAASSTALNSDVNTNTTLNGTLMNMTTTAASSFTGTSGWVNSNSPVNAPVDFYSYTYSTTFAGGSAVGQPYYTIVSGPGGGSVTVLGLTPGTWYDFNIYEYDEDAPQFYNYVTAPMATGEVQTAAGAVPTITSFTPLTGPVGTVVTITGTNFSPYTYLNTVYFGATKATVTAATATTLTVVVPYGANYNPITVEVSGMTGTAPREFIVTSSCAAAINPSSFTASTQSTSSTAYGFGVKDTDGDGKSDLEVTGYTGGSFTTLKGSSANGTIPPAFSTLNYTTGSNPYYLEVADVDCDAKNDVLTTSLSGDFFSVHRGAGSSFFTVPRYDFPTLSSPCMVKTGDIDGDGKLDVVVSYSSNNYISVFRNTGSVAAPDFATRQDISVGAVQPFALVVRDFDMDGKADIAFGEGNSATIGVFRSTSTAGSISFGVMQTFAASTGNINGIATGDFNLDGKPDLAIVQTTNMLRLFSNSSTSGNINFSLGSSIATAASNPYAVACNDLDGDGRVDVVVGYLSANTVSVYEATGSFGFAPRVDLTTSGSQTTALGIGDFNQDGKSDIVASTGSTTLNVLSNNMNPLASEPTSPSTGLSISGITQTSMTLNFTPGTGANRIVVAKQGGSVNVYPADGTNYTGNSVFGSGSDLGGGIYCVYNGNSNSVTVTNLQSNTYYYFAVFEYNGTTCTANYLTSSFASANTATLNTPPTLAAISNPASVCQNSGLQTVNFSGVGTGAANETQTMTVTATSNNTSLIPNPTVSYTSPNATGTLSYTPVLNATGTATITVTVNDGASNNATTTQTFVVTVNAPPTTSNAGPNQQICTATATLGANAPSTGTGTWSIVYTSNVAITTANLGNVNIPTTTLTGLTVGDSVRLAWTISSPPCSPSVSYVSIKRGTCPLTAGFTWSPNSVCATPLQINSINFTDASFAPSSTITSWSWSFTGPTTVSPANSSQQNPSNIQFTGPGTFTVSLTINDNVGGNSTTTQFITINPYPAGAGTISGPTSVCQGQNGVTYSVLPIANATSYNWLLPSGANIINGAGTSTIIVDFDVNAVSGPVQVQGINSCGAGAASPVYNVTVNPLPGATTNIFGPASVCQGQNNVMFRTPSIANASGYSWTLPSGATINGNPSNDTIYVNFSNSAVSGPVNVTGTNGCGSGTSSVVFNLTVNPLPDPAGTITTNQSGIVCQGQTSVTYSIAVLNNTSYYLWTLPVGASIVSGDSTNAITVDYNTSAASGNVMVYGVNGCGNGTAATLPVTIAPLPAAATAVTGQDSVCQGEFGVNFFTSSISGATSYVWSLPGGASISSGNNTNSIFVDFGLNATNGSVVVYGQNACGSGTSSSAFNVIVKPLPDSAGTVNGPAAVCQGQTGVTFSVPSIANAVNYNWYLPPGATITAGNNTNNITVDFSTTAVSGQVYVIGGNTCGNGGSSDTINLVVNPLPDAAASISGPSNLAICPLATGIVYSVPSVNNATYYVWSLPAGATIVAGDSTNTITVDFAAAASSGAVTVYGANACGTGASSSLNFTFATVTPVDICMVTVDGNSVYNHVIWDKPIVTDIDSFRIYREITSNNYTHIGSVPYDSLSVYVDSVYVPTADPNTTYFRYKLSAVDSCGNESVLSQHHRTLFLQANVGLGGVVNLNWSLYEGASVDYYRILRDSTGLGNWQVIDSVPGTTNLYTDNNPPQSASVLDIRYKLQTVWTTSCSPSRNIVTSESNLKDVPIAAFSVHENALGQQVSIFPNPSDGNFTIKAPYASNGYTITVFDGLGQIVYRSEIESKNLHPGENVISLPLVNLAKGSYVMTLDNHQSEPAHEKLIIQ